MAMFRCLRSSKELRCGPQFIDLDLDASVPLPSTAAASANHVIPLVAHRQYAQALPGKDDKKKRHQVSDLKDAEKRAKRASKRRKTSADKATAALRKSSPAYKAAAKNQGPFLKLRQQRKSCKSITNLSYKLLRQCELLLLRTRQQRKREG
jgi:hypothetical protein